MKNYWAVSVICGESKDGSKEGRRGEWAEGRCLGRFSTHFLAVMLPVLLTSVGIVTTASWKFLDRCVRQVM